VTDLGADLPFGQVAAKIKEHYGVDLAVSAPRTLTERVACELTEADCLPVAGPSNTAKRLIVETDGGMVPLVETVEGAADARKGKRTHWREAKVCIAQRQGEAVPKAGVTMEGPREAGAILKRLVDALGFGPKTQVHCVGDGAAWISSQIEELFGTQGTFLVDLFHVCEYLTPASKVCAPDSAQDWVASQKARFLLGQAREVVAEMKLHLEPASVDDPLYKIPSQPYNRRFFRGGIAQLGERLHGMQEVRGSIPRTSTSKSKDDFPGPHRLEAQDTTLSR
jgi:hypothetical protein